MIAKRLDGRTVIFEDWDKSRVMPLKYMVEPQAHKVRRDIRCLGTRKLYESGGFGFLKIPPI